MMLVHLTCAGNVELTVHSKILAIYRSVALGTIYCGVLCWGGGNNSAKDSSRNNTFLRKAESAISQNPGTFHGVEEHGVTEPTALHHGWSICRDRGAHSLVDAFSCTFRKNGSLCVSGEYATALSSVDTFYTCCLLIILVHIYSHIVYIYPIFGIHPHLRLLTGLMLTSSLLFLNVLPITILVCTVHLGKCPYWETPFLKQMGCVQTSVGTIWLIHLTLWLKRK